MSQVNLLPPEILKAQRSKRVTLLMVIAGAGVVALVFLFYLVQVKHLADVHSDIDAQNRTNAQFQSEIADLQKYETLQSTAQQKSTLLSAAYAGEISMSGLLMDLSSVTPSDSYLDSLNVQTGAPTGAVPATTTTTGAAAFVGNIQMSGQAIGFPTLSTWLVRLEQINGWVNPWMPSINTANPAIHALTFTISVDLTPDVLTPRGRGEVPAGG
jgi:Tfp pilus assembly protein PilN